MQEHGMISKYCVKWKKSDTRGHTEWVHLYKVQKQAKYGDKNEKIRYPWEEGGTYWQGAHNKGAGLFYISIGVEFCEWKHN